ncbi:MAG TPA: GNAT family protein [Clostridia bacterium]|nr:GNAT family protein [Clostridia bacterium]
MIKTERLLIRKFEESDASDLLEYLIKPRVDCFVPEKITTMEEAIAEAKKRSESETFYAVELSCEHKLIGNLYLQKGEYGTFDIGWNFNEKYEGKGYAFESAKALMDYAFDTLNARRIVAYTADNNVRSNKLLERLGMRKEGHFIETITFVNNPDGTPKWESANFYAILAKERNK